MKNNNQDTLEKLIEEFPYVNDEVENGNKRDVIEEIDTKLNDEDEASTEVE